MEDLPIGPITEARIAAAFAEAALITAQAAAQLLGQLKAARREGVVSANFMTR
jgi:hypothetical protein